MTAHLEVPTVEGVRAACKAFDQRNELAEPALAELFRQYPKNSDPRHVLLKVVAVNSLYHTAILAVDTVARHIHENHAEIDAALAAGNAGIVHLLARVRVQGKPYNFYAFATKYASRHNAAAYPVYDSHVDHYLWTLQKQNHFASFPHTDLLDYAKFCDVVTAFRDFHKLGACSFQELEKFLHVQGAPPQLPVQEERETGPGAFDFFPAQEQAT